MQDCKKQTRKIVVLLVLQFFFLRQFFGKNEFPEHFAKSKNLILITYFEILIFKNGIFKMDF